MTVTLKTAPTVEPVSRTELKLHCRVDSSDDDTLLDALEIAARQSVENHTGRALINQTWELRLDAFPTEIQLPICPVVSATISYVDSAGAVKTLSPTVYDVDKYSEPGRITPAYGQSVPATREIPNAVTVTFVSGYGATAASVPEALKCAIKLLAAHLYEHRESVGDSLSVLPLSVDFLCWQYRTKAIC
jgi:uncharacterized phiE125 gp8 family phage protein